MRKRIAVFLAGLLLFLPVCSKISSFGVKADTLVVYSDVAIIKEALDGYSIDKAQEKLTGKKAAVAGFQYVKESGSIVIREYYGHGASVIAFPRSIGADENGPLYVNYVEVGALVGSGLKAVYLPDSVMMSLSELKAVNPTTGEGIYFDPGTEVYFYSGDPRNIKLPEPPPAEPETPVAMFKGANIQINQDLKLQFYAEIKEQAEDVYVTVTDGNSQVTTVSEKELTAQGYRFSLPVDPSKMAETYQVRLMLGSKEQDSLSYGIRTYCENMYAKYATNTLLVSLLANLLEYGASVQIFADYHTDDLANSPSWVAEHISVFSDVTTDQSVVGSGDASAQFLGANLRLTDTVIVQCYATVTDESDLVMKLYRKSGTNDPVLVKEAEVTSGQFALESDELRYYELEDLYLAVLERNGAEIQRLTYSVRSYVASFQHTTKYAGLADLVQRLWMYGECAKQYK